MNAAVRQVVLTRRRFLQHASLAGVAGWTGLGLASRAIAAPTLAFRPGLEVGQWQTELRARLRSMLVLPTAASGPLDARVERHKETAQYTMDRIQFTAEPGEVVPGWLLKPKSARGPLPVMICLQGHSPGMHISIGEARNEVERKSIAGGRDLALQAVAHGWAALVIEQRAFGERAKPRVKCNDAALFALHQGRPLTGQRVFDVMRAIDFVATQRDLDPARIGCIGNSTGGTVSFYAACVEPRIALAVVSCSFCTYEDSWLSIPHCACGYLPGIVPVADMPDLAGLVAPRRLLIVAGREDNLARIAGVERGYRQAREIFAAAGVSDRVRLVVGEGGHQFYPKEAWPVISEMAREL
jgi:dienelactone hydrolase